MPNEYELKFLNIDKSRVRTLLESNGYCLAKNETLYRRQTYHLPKDNHEHESKWGRVRDEGDVITSTIKWYQNPDKPSISDVGEIEIKASSWEEGVDWIRSQGFSLTSYQENSREIWKKPNIDTLEICIDTWPGLNTYIEIEAASENEVKKYVEELGFDYSKGIAGGTEIIYEIELGLSRKSVKNLPEITFQNPPLKAAI